MFKLKKQLRKNIEQEIPWHYRLQIQRYQSDPVTILEEGKNDILQIGTPNGETFEVIRFNENTSDFSCIKYSKAHDIREVEQVLGQNIVLHINTILVKETQHIDTLDFEIERNRKEFIDFKAKEKPKIKI